MLVNRKHHLSPVAASHLFLVLSRLAGITCFSESVSRIIRAAVTWDAFARAQFSIIPVTFNSSHQMCFFVWIVFRSPRLEMLSCTLAARRITNKPLVSAIFEIPTVSQSTVSEFANCERERQGEGWSRSLSVLGDNAGSAECLQNWRFWKFWKSR